jgi:NADH dehydrogenase FAD-containing subunit
VVEVKVERIVVLGAGFAGLELSSRLARTLEGQLEIEKSEFAAVRRLRRLGA